MLQAGVLLFYYVLGVLVVSCGSETGTSPVGVCTRLRAFPIYGVAGAAVLLDWARGDDGVFLLTRREHHCASAGTALRLLLLTVRVVVVMKSCLPASKVGELVCS